MSATGGGVVSGGDVVWTLGSIPVSNGGKRRATVAVDGGLPDGALLVVDSASLTATINAQTQQSRATVVSRVQAGTTLKLAIEVDPDPVEPGETLELRARISNTSSSPTGTLTLRMHYPDLLYQFPVITGGATCPGGQCGPTELLTWNLAALPAHGSHTVSVATFVNGDAPTGSLIPFELELIENGGATAAAGHTVEVETARPLELTIDPVPDPVAPGGQLVYDLGFTNKGAAVATAAELRLPLPAGITFVSATGGGIVSGGDVVWNLGSIPASNGGKRRATVMVGGGLPDGALIIVDAASLTATVNAQTRQSRATVVSRVQAGATLKLAIEVDPDPVEPGEMLELRARISNTSSSPTGTLTLRMHYPDLLYQFPVITGGAVCPGGQCGATELLTWNLAALPAHGSHTVSMATLVNGNAPTGSLIPFELELLENGGATAAAGHTVEVETTRPLELTIDPAPDPVAPGGQLVYDLGFTNKGAAVATAAELRLPLPAGTTFVSATDGGTLSGGDVVWNLGSIPISTGAKRRATVTVDGGLPDGALLVVDAASVTATISAQTQQSRAMAMTRVEAATTLELALEVDPDPVEPGQLLDLRARISNTSNSATGALTLRLHYPDLLYQFPVATGGAICPGRTVRRDRAAGLEPDRAARARQPHRQPRHVRQRQRAQRLAHPLRVRAVRGRCARRRRRPYRRGARHVAAGPLHHRDPRPGGARSSSGLRAQLRQRRRLAGDQRSVAHADARRYDAGRRRIRHRRAGPGRQRDRLAARNGGRQGRGQRTSHRAGRQRPRRRLAARRSTRPASPAS